MPEMTYELNGSTLRFNPERDLSVSTLRHIELWFKDMDGYMPVSQRMALGDPDAIACLIWIAKRKNGESVREPRQSEDFAVGAFMDTGRDADGARTRRKPISFRFDVDGTTYTYDPDAITHHQLVKIKRWFPQLGSMAELYAGFAKGNADALASVIWAARTLAGEKEVPEPRYSEDYGIGEILSTLEPIDEEMPDDDALDEVAQPVEVPPEADENPTRAEETAPSPDSSTESPPSSGQST